MIDDGAMPTTDRETEIFERSRGRLDAIAYRLLGSAVDAEDAVQDTYLRWHGADRDRIEIPEAWLTRVLTNLCLTRLTSARARRETYVGQWLPEPLLDGDRMLGPADTVVQRDTVTMAPRPTASRSIGGHGSTSPPTGSAPTTPRPPRRRSPSVSWPRREAATPNR